MPEANRIPKKSGKKNGNEFQCDSALAAVAIARYPRLRTIAHALSVIVLGVPYLEQPTINKTDASSAAEPIPEILIPPRPPQKKQSDRSPFARMDAMDAKLPTENEIEFAANAFAQRANAELEDISKFAVPLPGLPRPFRLGAVEARRLIRGLGLDDAEYTEFRMLWLGIVAMAHKHDQELYGN